jgi:hypothetical protein
VGRVHGGPGFSPPLPPGERGTGISTPQPRSSRPAR